MKEDEMLMCLIAFVLGYLVARMMRGNGLNVGGQSANMCSIDKVEWDNKCNSIKNGNNSLYNNNKEKIDFICSQELYNKAIDNCRAMTIDSDKCNLHRINNQKEDVFGKILYESMNNNDFIQLCKKSN